MRAAGHDTGDGASRIAAFLVGGALTLLSLSACAAPRTVPRDLDGWHDTVASTRAVPDARAHDPQRAAEDLERARRLAGFGRPGAAVRTLDALLAREPRYLPAHRLLQDLLIDSPADWDLRRRYRLTDDPGADELYLAARIEPDRRRQSALFERALDLDPGHPWARVGRALTSLREGDVDDAEQEATEATRVAPELAMPWVFLGTLHLSRAEIGRAEEAFAAALARDPGDPRARLGRLAAARESGDRRAEAAAALAVLDRAPGDPGTVAAAVDSLVESGVPETLRAAAALLQSVDGAAGDPAAGNGLLGVELARLHLAAGRPEDALTACDRARAAGASHADVARVRRRAAVASGRYGDAVEGFLGTAPGALVARENRYGERWEALRAAARAAQTDGSATRHLALAEALLSLGWRAEAAVVLARAQAGGDPDVRRRAARRAARERAFDGFLEDVGVVARALRAAAQRGEDVADVDDVLAVLAGASTRRLGTDVTEGARIRSYPFLGEFAVTVGSDGAFARAFDARGLLLLVGRRRGGGTRIVMGRLLLVHADARARVADTTVRFDECWLETAGLPRHLDGLGTGLAGLTMDRLVLIHVDAALRGPPVASDIPLVPRPAPNRAERLALDTPSAVSARIEAALAAEGRRAADTLATVRHHELGHVLDAQRMLPVLAPPWRGLWLVLRHGFDGAAVEAHLEARAAVVALADGPAPRAALASLLGFLPETEGSTAHVRGYVDAVRRMVAEIDAAPEAFPSIRRDRNILQQMDRLSDAEARELGRRVLRDM